MRWKLVIFDCDGVLVNSEPLYARAFTELVEGLGCRLLPGAALDLVRGKSLHDCLVLLESRMTITVPDDFEKRFRQRVSELLRTDLSTIDGIETTLDLLPVPYCVASNSPLAVVTAMLTSVGLIGRFCARIYSAHAAGRWKPDPYVFLHAAASLQVEPCECAVVEDSEAGISAALAADMGVFGYDPVSVLQAHKRVRCFSNMSDLPVLLGVDNASVAERVRHSADPYVQSEQQ
jgi:HAD superfamily hydrolase (TIGR01509 family)